MIPPKNPVFTGFLRVFGHQIGHFCHRACTFLNLFRPVSTTRFTRLRRCPNRTTPRLHPACSRCCHVPAEPIGSPLPFQPMRLEGIQVGDIVEVDRLGRRFHALVTGNTSGGLSIQPLDRRISYRSCRAHDVVAHWAKRGRPRATDEPLEPSPLQLELDTTIRG